MHGRDTQGGGSASVVGAGPLGSKAFQDGEREEGQNWAGEDLMQKQARDSRTNTPFPQWDLRQHSSTLRIQG